MSPDQLPSPAMLSKSTWDRILQATSVTMTVAILPAAGWAWRITESQHEQQSQLRELRSELSAMRDALATDRRGHVGLLDELKALRQSVDTMRVDVLQRITRLETLGEKR